MRDLGKVVGSENLLPREELEKREELVEKKEEPIKKEKFLSGTEVVFLNE
jgi:hypothetical protein